MLSWSGKFWDILDMKRLISVLLMLMIGCVFSGRPVAAASCYDLEFVYARGSGGARNATAE